jgi:hypothetical protein
MQPCFCFSWVPGSPPSPVQHHGCWIDALETSPFFGFDGFYKLHDHNIYVYCRVRAGVSGQDHSEFPYPSSLLHWSRPEDTRTKEACSLPVEPSGSQDLSWRGQPVPLLAWMAGSGFLRRRLSWRPFCFGLSSFLLFTDRIGRSWSPPAFGEQAEMR